jgi:hypothetical protein
MKIVKGTFRKDRAHAPTVPALDGDPRTPKWLKGAARRIWHEKLADYEDRGQSVRGCEGPLAQYCALEADLIDARRRRIPITVALINAHRIYASEFYDTPASHQGPRAKATGNAFDRNGRRGRTA